MPGEIAMPAIAHLAMAAAMRNLKTPRICVRVIVVNSTIDYLVETKR